MEPNLQMELATLDDLSQMKGEIIEKLGALEVRTGTLEVRMGTLEVRMESLEKKMDRMTSIHNEIHSEIVTVLGQVKIELIKIIENESNDRP